MTHKQKTCCGVIEQAAETAREKRENRTEPQPWIVQKLMVGITIGIIGYCGYVYIARLCLPMIRRQAGAQAGHKTGIALLVVFSVLYLWLIWAYIRIVITAPGYARDYISKSERPLIPAAVPLRDSWQSSELTEPTEVDMAHRRSQQSRRASSVSRGHAPMRTENGLAGPSYEDLLRRADSRPSDAQDPNAGVMNSITVPKPAFMNDTPASPISTASTTINSRRAGPGPSITHNNKLFKKTRDVSPMRSDRKRDAERVAISRRPPTTAVLHPVHRYCTVEEIVKPYRTHHCRVCGTCVLKYDHHCPWIGQCVGARNHKFFLNFCQATVVLTAYMFGTLLAYTVKQSNASFMSDIDPQRIVVIALTGLFFIFTFMLVVSHVHLILKGQTTVESMKMRYMRERESAALANGYSWWEFRAKQLKRREWDQEWGVPNTEGNVWWRGNAHEEWTDVMGKWWLGWILPVGRSGNDGLSYPVNPRFDAEGRWRRRVEWPEHLR